ncbi:hypothetical protein GQ457_15G029280 [Hibiscus cannabinus]
MGESIADRWRELSGENNWEGLLQPLDPDLRRYIIHYGQMAGAAGDLFNSRTRRRYTPASKETFFSQACLVEGNPYQYKVSRYIYTVETAWIGYVAVVSDRMKHVLGRRDIVIAWRGTATTSEWRDNFHVLPRATASDIFTGRTNVKVHRGFHSLHTATNPTEQVRILHWAENKRRDRWFSDVGEDQDIGKDQDQDGCDLITISEDGVGVGVGDDHLRDDYKLPSNWWADEDRRGMVQMNKDGRWRRGVLKS